MRFRFCGDADCPDWILAEISSLSRLSSVKLKLLAQVAVEGMLQPPIDLQKAGKLFVDSKLDSDIDLEACIACLANIITSAVRFNCDSSILQRELQQLGLPREHTTAINKIMKENRTDLAANLRKASLRVDKLKGAKVTVDNEIKLVTIDLDIEGHKKSVTLTPSQLDALLKDLREVRNTMIDLEDIPSMSL